MKSCCENEVRELSALRQRQAKVLWVCLVANLTMFFVEFTAGLWSESTSLKSDSLEMLGDAFVYAFSLNVLHHSRVWRARAALSKGLLMAAFALVVLSDAVLRLRAGTPPLAAPMAAFGSLALVVNALSFALLYRHRSDDSNLRSTWLCTRNDVIANVALICAACAVAWSGSHWPDVIVGVAVAGLFLRTSVAIVRDSLFELGGALPDRSGQPVRLRSGTS
ncbi:MAG: cation transporter [bacterium]